MQIVLPSHFYKWVEETAPEIKSIAASNETDPQYFSIRVKNSLTGNTLELQYKLIFTDDSSSYYAQHNTITLNAKAIRKAELDDIEDTMVHEATHALEFDYNRTNQLKMKIYKQQDKYYTSPHEVRAFMAGFVHTFKKAAKKEEYKNEILNWSNSDFSGSLNVPISHKDIIYKAVSFWKKHPDIISTFKDYINKSID